jgi:hypothetical protein
VTCCEVAGGHEAAREKAGLDDVDDDDDATVILALSITTLTVQQAVVSEEVTSRCSWSKELIKHSREVAEVAVVAEAILK